MADTKTQETIAAAANQFDNPDPTVQAEYEEAERRWKQKLAPMIEANLNCEKLSSDDFAITITAKD